MTNEQAAKVAAIASANVARAIRSEQAYDAADAAFGVWVAERNARKGSR